LPARAAEYAVSAVARIKSVVIGTLLAAAFYGQFIAYRYWGLRFLFWFCVAGSALGVWQVVQGWRELREKDRAASVAEGGGAVPDCEP